MHDFLNLYAHIVVGPESQKSALAIALCGKVWEPDDANNVSDAPDCPDCTYLFTGQLKNRVDTEHEEDSHIFVWTKDGGVLPCTLNEDTICQLSALYTEEIYFKAVLLEI